jgi:hypothetical protein
VQIDHVSSRRNVLVVVVSRQSSEDSAPKGSQRSAISYQAQIIMSGKDALNWCWLTAIADSDREARPE